MARAIHVFRTPPDRFVAGTVGEPGDRVFYLQAVHDSRVVSVMLEKQQVKILADRMGLLLEEVHRRFGTDLPDDPDIDISPLITPHRRRVPRRHNGPGWDADSSAVVVELLAVTEAELDESVVLDDTEDGPDAVRVFLTPPNRPSSSRPARKWSSPPAAPPRAPPVRRTHRRWWARVHPDQRLPAHPPGLRSRILVR